MASHDPDGRLRPGYVVELSDCATRVVVGNATSLNTDDLQEVTRTGLRVGIVKARYFTSETNWRPIQVADIAYDWVAHGHLPTPPAHYARVVWQQGGREAAHVASCSILFRDKETELSHDGIGTCDNPMHAVSRRVAKEAR